MLTTTATTTTATTTATTTTTTALDCATWVESAPFRAHLLFVSHACDVSWPVLAALAGVSQRGARALVVGRGRQPLRRIHPGIASRVLALDETRVRHAADRMVGGEHVRHRLVALTTAGWTVADLAERVRMPLVAPGLSALLQEHELRPAACTELIAAVVGALTILCGSGGPPTALTVPTTADPCWPAHRVRQEAVDTLGRAA